VARDLPPIRHPAILRGAQSLLVVVDCQERLVPAMADAGLLIRRAGILLEGARLLEVPTLLTEQYPQGLGATVPELAARAHGAPRLAKTAFGGGGDPAFRAAVHASDRTQVVLAGIEAHICVAQTALDLLAMGYAVHVATDAVASRRGADREMALLRLAGAGAVPTTVESVLFEWMGSSEHPAFKAVSGLIR
jgi:nicotinamidase-related amidase